VVVGLCGELYSYCRVAGDFDCYRLGIVFHWTIIRAIFGEIEGE